MDLNLELTNIAPTEIPSPLKFYLDGYSTEDSFILFNAYLKKANQSLDQKFMRVRLLIKRKLHE